MAGIGPFAKPEASVPEGQIPGLRGAPTRTPVRPSGARPGVRLWPLVAGRLMTRQIWIELYGLPGYGQTLKGRPWGLKPSAFSAAPRDFRPLEAAGQGKSILQGRFTLAGISLDVPAPQDPWDRASPSRGFAEALHSYDWLPSLMQEGEAGAREALRLTLAWGRVFHRWAPFAWDPDRMARRLLHLAPALRRMGTVANDTERGQLAVLVARQARQLLRPPGPAAGAAPRAVAVAVTGCAVAGLAGARLRRRGLKRLARVLPRSLRPDGALLSRSPEAGLELLFDLLMLKDGMTQLSETLPETVETALGQLAVATRSLVMPDGRLPGVHGGGVSTPVRVSAALSAAGLGAPSGDGQAPQAPVGGLARMRSPLLSLMIDVEPPPRGAWTEAACAQPLALEIVCGRDRLITGCGWTPRAFERQGLRLTPGHSTLTLSETSLGEPLGGWQADLMGPRLLTRPYSVHHEERQGDGALWLEAQHDGWAPLVGLSHQRRLYLDQRLDELRAEERLFPADQAPTPAPVLAAPYAVRFQLEPGVQASLARDRRSILLRGHSGRGWWFRTDGPDVAIEPSVHCVEGQTRRALQIVVRGSARTDAETRIRWKLNPAGASGDPVVE
jgi:uncharacterized heparinase superfamily protein